MATTDPHDEIGVLSYDDVRAGNTIITTGVLKGYRTQTCWISNNGEQPVESKIGRFVQDTRVHCENTL